MKQKSFWRFCQAVKCLDASARVSRQLLHALYVWESVSLVIWRLCCEWWINSLVNKFPLSRKEKMIQISPVVWSLSFVPGPAVASAWCSFDSHREVSNEWLIEREMSSCIHKGGKSSCFYFRGFIRNRTVPSESKLSDQADLISDFRQCSVFVLGTSVKTTGLFSLLALLFLISGLLVTSRLAVGFVWTLISLCSHSKSAIVPKYQVLANLTRVYVNPLCVPPSNTLIDLTHAPVT